jgi:CheY-like chemotaxis protein
VKRLVEMHGGTVVARSEGLGRGSEFVVRLPASVLSSDDGEVREPAADGTLASLRVLVVDDNRDAADTMVTLLDLLGATTRVAHSGPDALAALPGFEAEAILLDLGMPGMDGYEVARRIRQDPRFRDVTLIALTGWGQEEDRRRTRSAGFDHHLVKPIDFAELKALLGSLKARERA